MALHSTNERETAAFLTSSNPLIAAGVDLVETDTGKYKTGDGITRWNAMPYTGTIGGTPAVALTPTTGAAVIDVTANHAKTVTHALTGNVTYTTSGRVAGYRVNVVITADAAIRTLGFPAWTFVGGAAPASIAASKVALLELIVTGTTEASVLARYSVQA